MPACLSQIDMHGDLPQPAFQHQPLEEFRMLEQRLPVRHQHWNQADSTGVTHDFDQLILSPGAKIGIGDIAASDLQAAARTLETPVGIDLFLHLRERRHRHLVRVFRQVTMRAVK